MLLLQLFWVFNKIGLFAIGGAYSFLPLLEYEIVDKYHWLTKEEFLEVLGAVQILPGAISVKYASYVGYKIAGIPGAIMATLGNVLVPSILIILLLNFFLRHKDRPAVAGAFRMIDLAIFAMIIATAFKLVNIGSLIQFKTLAIIIASFVLFSYTSIHPALILISAGIIGAILR